MVLMQLSVHCLTRRTGKMAFQQRQDDMPSLSRQLRRKVGSCQTGNMLQISMYPRANDSVSLTCRTSMPYSRLVAFCYRTSTGVRALQLFLDPAAEEALELSALVVLRKVWLLVRLPRLLVLLLRLTPTAGSFRPAACA